MSNLERVLVTGGAGFIGSHAAAYYADKGVEVTALDNMSRIETLESADEDRNTAAYNWEYLRHEYPNITLIREDVRNYDELKKIIKGHDAVVHTAGQVAVTSSLDDPRTDFEVNTLGTFNVLEAARTVKSDPAVVVDSTKKVY